MSYGSGGMNQRLSQIQNTPAYDNQSIEEKVFLSSKWHLPRL